MYYKDLGVSLPPHVEYVITVEQRIKFNKKFFLHVSYRVTLLGKTRKLRCDAEFYKFAHLFVRPMLNKKCGEIQTDKCLFELYKIEEKSQVWRRV